MKYEAYRAVHLTATRIWQTGACSPLCVHSIRSMTGLPHAMDSQVKATTLILDTPQPASQFGEKWTVRLRLWELIFPTAYLSPSVFAEQSIQQTAKRVISKLVPGGYRCLYLARRSPCHRRRGQEASTSVSIQLFPYPIIDIRTIAEYSGCRTR